MKQLCAPEVRPIKTVDFIDLFPGVFFKVHSDETGKVYFVSAWGNMAVPFVVYEDRTVKSVCSNTDFSFIDMFGEADIIDPKDIGITEAKIVWAKSQKMPA